MYDLEVVKEALRLRDEDGLGARRVAKRLGVPLGTVRDWHAGKLPRALRPDPEGKRPELCRHCGHERHGFDSLGERYVYLLGLYLGDGTISRHPRDAFKLRVFLDRKYPDIVDECASAMTEVMPASQTKWFSP